MPEEYAVEYVVDRIETTSTVFMGVTLGCARCHNHKYDPVYAEGVLPGLRLLQQRAGERPRHEVRQLAADRPGADHGSSNGTGGPGNQIRQAGKSLPEGRANSRPVRRTAQPARRIGIPPMKCRLKRKRKALVARSRRQSRQAAVFDGKAYLDGGDAGGFDIDDRFTLSAWIYAGFHCHRQHRLQDDRQARRARATASNCNNGKVHVHLTSSYVDDAIRVETEETIEPKRWYNITVTYDGSDHGAGRARVHRRQAGQGAGAER